MSLRAFAFTALAFMVAAACGSSGNDDTQTPGDGSSDSGASTTRPDGGSIATGGDSGSGGTDATASGDSGPDLSVHDGILIGGPGSLPGALAGLDYRTATQKGTTDAAGTFHFIAGETITFTVAGVELGSTAAKAKLSPFDLAGPTCTVSDALKRVLVTLMTLDADANADDGYALPTIAAPANESRKLATMAEADYLSWLVALSTPLTPARSVADPQVALQHFIITMDDEGWTRTADMTFDTVTATGRSQGIAWDGTNYYFSWNYGLENTDATLKTITRQAASIPFDMLLAGSDHIGDIDVYNGTLYAPVEDSKNYAHPTIVLYDAKSLSALGTRHEIPTSLLSKGVPWVAVNGPKNVAYVAEWDPTPQIYVMDLATFAQTGSIPLSTPMARIQGGKVAEGALYVTVDNTDKTIYKIDLETGVVLPLMFTVGATDVAEVEGLAFVPGSPAMIRVLTLGQGRTSVSLHDATRTRTSLRSELCAP